VTKDIIELKKVVKPTREGKTKETDRCTIKK